MNSKYNKSNFFEKTTAEFKQMANIHSDMVWNKRTIKGKRELTKMVEEKTNLTNLKFIYQSNHSFYLVNQEETKLIRVSNHWGWVRTCLWRLKEVKKNNGNYKWNIGICNFKNFKHNLENYYD